MCDVVLSKGSVIKKEKRKGCERPAEVEKRDKNVVFRITYSMFLIQIVVKKRR